MTGHPLENGASASPSGLPESECGPSRTPSHEPSGQSQSAADRHGTQSTSAPEPLQLELGKQSSRPVHERYPPDPTLAGTAQPAASCSVDAEPELPEPVVDLKGWRRPRHQESLPEVHSSIKVPEAWHKKVLAFAGVGILVAVGYMDPGNWATDLSAGSEFGYLLLFAVLLSSLAAMFLQYLSLKLGVAGERDLAQACRDAYPRWLVYILWIMAEVAIAATDLAEVIGSATALYLLFGLPLWAGVLITVVDVLIILAFGTRSFRIVELIVFMLVATIAGSFVYELALVKPNWKEVGKGFIPKARIITESGALYNAIGIMGATVMPHNIYLHSSLIMTRAYPRTTPGKRMAIKFGCWDSCISLVAAFFVNAAILILAAAAFYRPDGKSTVAYISDAYHLITQAVGNDGARIMFGIALLASGQNSTITGTLAGQVVLEGFLQVNIPPWMRRLVTRLVSIIPAAVVAGVAGNRGAGKLLVLSQVILSLTLVFAVAPLSHFTCSRAKMGPHVNGWPASILTWLLTFIIAGLNTYLIIMSIKNNEFGSTTGV